MDDASVQSRLLDECERYDKKEYDSSDSLYHPGRLNAHGTRWSRILLLVGYPVSLLLISLSAFVGGSVYGSAKHTQQLTGVVNQVPIGSTRVTFGLNESFANAPPSDGAVEPYWDSLLPNGLGYVKGVPLAPDYSVISAFHQLHCLYTLRRAYFSSAREGVLEDFDFGRTRQGHVKHCFEYLRQAIMCSADPTVEPAAVEHEGFLGWGFQRQCRDFEGLKQWASEARAFTAHGFLAKDLVHSRGRRAVGDD